MNFEFNAQPAKAGIFRILRNFFACVLALGLIQGALAQEPPPSPSRHVADHANVLQPGTVTKLVTQLETFERETSSQVVVWIEPKLPANATLEDYVTRSFNAWGIGQRDKNNGVLLAVFVNDRKLRIEVGRGLERALPDDLCSRIIANEIAPLFKQGDYDRGIRAGVDAILAATKGEYRAVAHSRGPQRTNTNSDWMPIVFVVLTTVGTIAWVFFQASRMGWTYDHRGRHTHWRSSWPNSPGSWPRPGGFGGGGHRSSGGGGFRGGGGSSRGGGASGGW